MHALRVSGVHKSFGTQPVLKGVDLYVPGGCFAAVLGPSGCGKTTLLRAIAGFEHTDRGTIEIGGQRVSDERTNLPPERRKVGFVPQEGALFPHLSVAENVAFGLPKSQRRTGRVEEMLELTGLAGLGNRMPHELSGGQQQRVALARALAPAPALVLLDEPFSALDAGLRAAMRVEVREALARSGATALLVTHDQEEALSLADLVAVMQDGRLVQTADPATIYRCPVDEQVATFLGDAVLLPGYISSGAVECVFGRLPVHRDHCKVNGQGVVMLRPEQVALDPESRIRARVLSVTYYGHDAMVKLRLSTPGAPIHIPVRMVGTTIPSVGEEVGLRVDGPVMAYPVRR